MTIQEATRGPVEHEWYLCNLARKELTDEWLLTRSIWPSLFFTTAYLLFVLQIGPQLMKNRKAFNLKLIVLIFNLIQCAINTYSWTTVLLGARWKHITNNWCHPADEIDSRECQRDSFLIWLYYVTKLTDLLDTVLFILRKKQSHITVLHVYHHAMMVPATQYVGLTFAGSQILIVGGINSLVHTVMYTYYFLAAFGPGMQKYLWWKIYVTRLQMAQFVIIVSYMTFLLVNQCALPETKAYPIILGAGSFLILFLNFYIRAYINRGNKLDDTSEKKIANNKSESPHEKES